MSLIKLPLGGNNKIIPGRGREKPLTFFYSEGHPTSKQQEEGNIFSRYCSMYCTLELSSREGNKRKSRHEGRDM
jgi:hypothetical protein